MATFNYGPLKQTVGRILTQFGTEADIIRKTVGAYDVTAGTKPVTETKNPAIVIYASFSQEDVVGGVIPSKEHVKIIIHSEFEVKMNDHVVTIDKTTNKEKRHRIDHLTKASPDQDTVLVWIAAGYEVEQ